MTTRYQIDYPNPNIPGTYVDGPEFSTREAAVRFMQDTWGADEEGAISLISSIDDGAKTSTYFVIGTYPLEDHARFAEWIEADDSDDAERIAAENNEGLVVAGVIEDPNRKIVLEDA